MPSVPDRSSDHRVVLLLHKAVVVLLVGPAACERDLVLTTVPEQMAIDELTPVV